MDQFLHFLDVAKSAYHTVAAVSEQLDKAGFTSLSFEQNFTLEAGGKYYVTAYDTSLFAFTIPAASDDKLCLKLACAHTDFPGFKLKPEATFEGLTANCNRINVEPYGGALKRTWFDRPLGIAGKLVMKGTDPFTPLELLFDSEEAWVVIPSLAPHMDREIEKRELEQSKELMPICMLSKDQDLLDAIVAQVRENAEADYYEDAYKDVLAVLEKADILSYDLSLYDTSEAECIGVNGEFLQAESIDNVSSVAALVDGMLHGKGQDNQISMIALFDSEEIGNCTKQGADSNVLGVVLDKIFASGVFGTDQLAVDNLKMNSMINGYMVSVDVAHAVHPNYTEKADLTTKAVLSKGFVIKTSASQRYVTDAKVTAILKALCDEHEIPYQMQANKTGTPGGQTLGPITTSKLPMPAADIGIPMLAMHSIRELACPDDYEALRDLMRVWL